MRLKTLSAAAILALAVTPVAFAVEKLVVASAIKCHPAALTTVEKSPSSHTTTHFSVQCYVQNSDKNGGPVSLVFKGNMPSFGGAPYSVQASYHLQLVQDNIDLLAAKRGSGLKPAEGLEGLIESTVSSVAALPTHLQQQMRWDAKTAVLSIQERPGIWQILQLKSNSVKTKDSLSEGESPVNAGEWAAGAWSSAGYAHQPVEAGKTSTRILLDDSISRFSAATGQAPSVLMVQGLRDGKLENLLGSTRVQNQEVLRDAIILLDRQPKDITRAWAVSSIAQFLGLPGEMHYAIHKVAANNPNLLKDFIADVSKIESYVIPAAQQPTAK